MASATQSTGMSMEAFLAVGTTLVVASSLSVAVRLWANWRYINKRLLADDYISAFAPIFLATAFALTNEAVNALTNPATTLFYLEQLAIATSVLLSFSMWTSKAPVLILYIRLFGIEIWIRLASYITLVVSALVFIVGSSVANISCTPEKGASSASHLEKCAKQSSTIGVLLGTVAVLTDVIILVLPLPIIFKLRVSLAKKLGLAVLFLTGVFGLAASSVSLYFKSQSLTGTTTDMTSAMICTIIECSIAIIDGCIPSIYSFVSRLRHRRTDQSANRGGFIPRQYHRLMKISTGGSSAVPLNDIDAH